ncbi:MAG: 1-phosphofructokinase family hexose kinase [Planctomycetota bacterium]
MAQIVTVTINPAIDESTSVEHVQANQKLRCEAPSFYPGGGGINVARAVHRLGGEAEAWYTSGGSSGQMLQGLLHEEGVSCCAIPIQGRTRTNVSVWERASDRQYRFGMPGPRLEQPEWQQYLDAARELDPVPDYLVASGSLARGVPDEFYAKLAETVRNIGARFIVDTSGEPLRKAMEAGVYLVKPNLRELNHLAGRELKEEWEQERMAGELVQSGRAEVVVLSLGAGGAFLASSEGNVRLRSPTVPIRSRVGAGDSMMAGIVLALSRGRSLKEALNFGGAAGTVLADTRPNRVSGAA